MTDVSARAFAYFRISAERGLMDLDALLDGFVWTRAELEDPSVRLPWADWVELVDRFKALLGSDEAVEASAARVIGAGYPGPLFPLAPFLRGAGDLYWIGMRWFAPSVYRNIHFGHHTLPSGRVHLTIEIPPEDRDSITWLRLARGIIAQAPTVMGLERAQVGGEVRPRRLDVTVSLPPGRTLRGHARRVWSVMRGAGSLLEELAEQQAQLTANQAALTRAERGFRAALDTLPTPVAILRDTRVVHANRRLVDILGMSPAGREMGSLVSPADRGRVETLLETRSGASTEFGLEPVEGPSVPVEGGFLGGFAFDGRPATVFFATDLRERQRAARALERSEETNRLLLAAFPDTVIRVNRDGRILDLKAGRELPNAHLLAPLIGQHLADIGPLLPGLGDELIERALDTVTRTIDAQAPGGFEFSTSVLGEPREFDARVFPQSPDEALTLVRDISARRRMERQLAVTERMASLGTVAAGVAHEINNPLTFVSANLELAIEDLRDAIARGKAVDPIHLLESLEEAREGASRVRQIVGDLRLFSRGPASVLHPVDVIEVIESALKMTRSELLPRVSVRLDLPVVGMAEADRNKLAQVLVNLFTNAAQAMPEDRPPQLNVLEVRTREDRDHVRLEVEDNGVGIDDTELDRIFEPFFTTKHRRGGTGLGLSICQRLVQEMGGVLEVDSEPGRGSRFTIELRRDHRGPSLETPESGTLPALAVDGKILIVDDEPMVARALARTLETHDVTVEGSGQEALARLRASPFELVICDLMMPGMTGPELYERACAEDPSLARRFLFVTGGAVAGPIRAFFEANRKRCLTKPVDPNELRARVAKAVARVRAGGKARSSPRTRAAGPSVPE